MTLGEVIDTLQTWIRNADDEYDREEMGRVAGLKEALHEIKKIEPCGKDMNVPATDAISRQAVLDMLHDMMQMRMSGKEVCKAVCELPPARPKTEHCKDCKYFEYDSAVKVDGAPLIVAHEICSKWGNGCKTREDGYCFLFEPQESEGKNDN